VLAASLACSSFGGARPRFAPLPQAVVRETQGPADELTARLATLMRDSGLVVAVEAPREGYLESRWYDLDRRRSVGEPFRRLDRIVKLRIYVDPVGRRTRVIGECVRRVAWDPSRPNRELESMVPDAHPGRDLLAMILAGLPARDTVAAGP
jgi:hypothetical protein